jgi:hypothetical protein
LYYSSNEEKGEIMKRYTLCCLFLILLATHLFSASTAGRMGAQIGLGVVGGATGFMIGTANACCVSCVSFASGPDLGDIKFLSGTMTIGGLVGTVLGGTAGVYFTGNLMVDEGVEVENPWETFFATMAGGFASCGTGYLVDVAMHKARGDEDVRPSAFYLVGLMLSPVAETFLYHQVVKETELVSPGASQTRALQNNTHNPKIIQFNLTF